MTQEFSPITPPPELVKQWTDEAWKGWRGNGTYERDISTQAARWGADQELEACCSQLAYWGVHGYNKLYAARRPKPPSLKEQALKAVQNIDDACESEGFSRADDTDIIRRALEMLPNE